MIQRISDYLGVDHDFFESRLVHDPFIGIDSELFIDPRLLETSTIPEFAKSRKEIEDYFNNIIVLLSASRYAGDLAWKKSKSLLSFKEIKGLSIGYSKKSGDGNAIGPRLANSLVDTASEIISLGIKDPLIFQLLGLFDKGLGADRLSDMTARIIIDDIFKYSERITKELNLVNDTEKFRGKYNLLRYNNTKNPILFLPKDILRDLPIALDFEDIDYLVAFNKELRESLNQIVGLAWGNSKKPRKQDYRALFLSQPDKLKELVNLYSKRKSLPYDFDIDPLGIDVWYDYGQRFARENPIDIVLKKPKTIEEVEIIVGQIVNQFKKNIELNGLNKLLYVKGKHRPEKYVQLLFFCVADAYCQANNLDLSPEVNSGSGAVDFKISDGYEKRVVVETKLSTNGTVFHGFSVQLPLYAQSESSLSSFFLIIQVSNNMNQIRRVINLSDVTIKNGLRCPDVKVINGRLYPSASHRKPLLIDGLS